MTSTVLRSPTTISLMQMIIRRQISSTTPAMQQAAKIDPIKQAFADKVREYTQKQKVLGDTKLVDADADVNKSYQDELDRVNRYYQVKTQDEFVKFPQLQFDEPKFDSIDLHEPRQEDNLRW